MKPYTFFSVLLLGLSNIAQANEQLTDQERSAVALLGSIMDIVSAKIDASSCLELKDQYPLKLFASGIGGERRQNNMATVKLPIHDVSVVAYIKDKIPEIGSQILTAYARTSDYDLFDPIKKHDAIYSFNADSNLLSANSNLALYTDNSYLKTKEYRTEAIISFNPSESEDAYATNIGWGMSRLSNSEYAKSNYWQRLKFSREDDTNARTVFVRDLLAYRETCRIKIDIDGNNNSDFISQEGFLTIDLSYPNDPVGISFN